MCSQYEDAVAAQLRAMDVTDPGAVILVGAAMDGLVRRQMDVGDPAATERAIGLLTRVVAMLADQP